MSERSLAEHRAVVLAGLRTMPALDAVLANAPGAMLAADIVADFSVPPTAVAACDGYVVASEDCSRASSKNPVVLPVTHDLSFATAARRSHVRGTAARIVSGAAVPHGADAVVPLAATDRGVARVALRDAPRPGDNVLAAGSDIGQGEIAVAAGVRLTSRHVALAASLGVARLKVHPVPRVVVIAVGDELVEPGSAGRHAISTGAVVSESTGRLVADLVTEAGAWAYRVGVVADDRQALRAAIEDQVVRADVIVTTGGLSEGLADAIGHDTVGEVLASIGEVEIVDVRLTPGGRHGFGALAPEVGARGRAVPVIALPGRPVAAIAAFEAYVRPALRAMSGQAETDRPAIQATVAQGWSSPPGVVHMVPVLIEGSSGAGYTARPAGDPARPSLAAAASANGVVMVEEDVTSVPEGSAVSCSVWS